MENQSDTEPCYPSQMSLPTQTPGGTGLGATAQLLEKVRGGDENAIRDLVELYRPMLERWASGRLPARARGLVDTTDLVHVSLVRVLGQVQNLDVSRPGAFLAYLRRSLLNQMRNQIRAAESRPRGAESVERMTDLVSVEAEVGDSTLRGYEDALSRLPESDQAAVILRVEFRLKYHEIA